MDARPPTGPLWPVVCPHGVHRLWIAECHQRGVGEVCVCVLGLGVLVVSVVVALRHVSSVGRRLPLGYGPVGLFRVVAVTCSCRLVG